MSRDDAGILERCRLQHRNARVEGACLDRRVARLLPSAARPIGLRDDADHRVRGRQQPVERRHRELRRAEEDDAQRASWLPFAGARQLLDPPDDQIALDAAQAIDEQRAVEVIHFVLKRAREETGAFALVLGAGAIESFHDRAFGPDDGGVEARNAEAAFFFELHAFAHDELGLTITIRPAGSRPSEMSTTKIRSGTPICGAASPIPGAAYIVSIMSAMTDVDVRRDRVNGSRRVVQKSGRRTSESVESSRPKTTINAELAETRRAIILEIR